MFRGRLPLALWIAIAAAGCALRPAAPDTEPLEGGSVWVYLAALPPGAERISIGVRGVAAVGEGGETVSLRLELGRIGGEPTSRERLVAWGAVAPGRYAGLELEFEDPALPGHEGAVPLAAPPGPVRVEAPFEVGVRAASVVGLSLDAGAAVVSGSRLEPAFSASAPRRVATGLIGAVSSRTAGTVTLFDKATREVAAVVPVGPEPVGIAADARRSRAYVAVSGADAVEVLDLQGASLIDRLALSGGDRPTELALAPGGRRLLVVNSGSNTLSVVDAGSLVEERRVAVGSEPTWVVPDREGRRAFVVNSLSDSISVVDLLADAPPLTVALEAEPVRAGLDRGGGRLYVAHRVSPYLVVLDTGSLAVLRRVYVGPGATALAVDRRTDRIYLARSRTGVVEVFDSSSLLPVDEIPVEGEVSHIAVDAEGNSLFLALPRAGGVGVVGLTSKRPAPGLDVGAGPSRLAFAGGE